MPAEYRFSKTDIIDRKIISPDSMRIRVRHHGLAASPELEEEANMHFLRENGEWKRDY